VLDYEFDILVIGCGIAGLTTAAKLAENGYKVGVVTRESDPLVSNTYWAQGGIIYPEEEDRSLIDDILRASAHTASVEAATTLAVHGRKVINDVLFDKAKPSFEKNEQGELKLTLEAAHSKPRILYRGDYTGKEIQVSLLNYLKNRERFPNVSMLTSHTAIDLLTPMHHGTAISQRYEENRVVGAYLLNQEKRIVTKAMARVTVLATGGIGSLYLHHSNSEGARGDGHAMARRAGAILTDMEFIQFHPTTFYDGSTHRRFLISEALRGEGGRLLNSRGERFMERYHPDLELAPRDVVARAIAEEIIETRHDCVYLDITHKDPRWIQERFPTIYHHCMEKKVDPTLSPIPVVPAAHYTCGGIKTDLTGKTSLSGLYAVGEVACTGLHGANRLASTSLLEGLTWGYLAALDIHEAASSYHSYDSSRIKSWVDGEALVDPVLIQQDMLTIKQTMWNYVGLTRSSHRLARAEAMFKELEDEIQKFYKNASLADSLIGLRNAVEVAHLVLNASRRNKESIGCFYRRS
jgi:L-aspartate oxidase